MNASSSPLLRYLAPLALVATATMASASWYFEPEKAAAWSAVLAFTAVMVLAGLWARGSRTADTIRRSIVLASLMLMAGLSENVAAGLGLGGSALFEQISSRGAMVLTGVYFMSIGNALPKLLTPLSAAQCSGDPIKAQAFQRFAGWVFVLTGLSFTAAWLALPVDIANPVAMMCLIAGMVVTATAIVRLRRAHRPSTRLLLVALLLGTPAAAAAQPAATPAAPAFEVASIKPSPPGDPSNPLSIIPMASPQPGGRFRATNLPLRMLISTAWELPDFRISGGPGELMNAKYDITALAAGGRTLGQKDVLPLLRTLLIERFKLKTHIEQREMPLYDLVLARSDGRLGPDLKPSKSDCSNADELNAKRAEALASGDLSAVMGKPGEPLTCTLAPDVSRGPMNISVHGDGQEIGQLIELLIPMSGRYIRDKTGLTGRYDFDMRLDLRSMLVMAQGMGVPVPPEALAKLPQSDGSSLMTALGEQLGLKLESTRGLVDVLVIDSADAPAAD